MSCASAEEALSMLIPSGQFSWSWSKQVTLVVFCLILQPCTTCWSPQSMCQPSEACAWLAGLLDLRRSMRMPIGSLRSEQICFAHKKPVGCVGDDGHHDGQQESAEHMLTRCDSASWEKPFYEYVLIAHDMSHKACILVWNNVRASHHLCTKFVFEMHPIMRVYVIVHVGLHSDLLHP